MFCPAKIFCSSSITLTCLDPNKTFLSQWHHLMTFIYSLHIYMLFNDITSIIKACSHISYIFSLHLSCPAALITVVNVLEFELQLFEREDWQAIWRFVDKIPLLIFSSCLFSVSNRLVPVNILGTELPRYLILVH